MGGSKVYINQVTVVVEQLFFIHKTVELLGINNYTMLLLIRTLTIL